MTVETWPTDKLKPYAGNPRKISAKAIDKVAASLAEFGWRQPVVVDRKGVIVVGHTRLLAARKLGLETVPVHVADLTAKQAKAYRLADNRTGEEAVWDDDLLALELEGLGDFDLSLTGFDPTEIEGYRKAREGLTDPDDVPPVEEQAISRRGDLWLLGEHRLLCGDATSREDVERLLDGGAPHLMVTDPPWGVNYDPAWRQTGWTGPRSIGKVENDDRADWSAAWGLFPGDVVYCWAPAGPSLLDSYQALVGGGFEPRMQIIWAKQHFPIGRGNYHVQHEPCWYAVRKGKTAHWQGSRKESTLWRIANTSAFGGEQDDARTNHGTQKPVECMRRPIENNSRKGNGVYDPFVGSGTTIIAAQQTGRRCYALEIAEHYVDVAIRRWQDFAGAEATLDGDGATFAEIAASRAQPATEAA